MKTALKRIPFILLWAMLILPAQGDAPPKDNALLFRTTIHDLQKTPETSRGLRDLSEPLEFAVPGKLFAKPQPIHRLSESASRDKSLQAAMAGFCERGLDNVERELGWLHGMVKYRDFACALIELNTPENPYRLQAFATYEGLWMVADELSQDQDFDIIQSAYERGGLVSPVRRYPSLSAEPSPGSKTYQVSFRSRVEQVGMSASYREEGHASHEILEATLPGQLYATPMELSYASKEEGSRDSIIASLRSFYSAIQAEDRDWIAGNWATDERVNIRNMLENDELFDRYLTSYSSKTSMQAWGFVKHGSYLLALVNYNDEARGGAVLVFVKDGKQWLATNSLVGDRTLDLVYSAFWQNGYLYEPVTSPADDMATGPAP